MSAAGHPAIYQVQDCEGNAIRVVRVGSPGGSLADFFVVIGGRRWHGALALRDAVRRARQIVRATRRRVAELEAGR